MFTLMRRDIPGRSQDYPIARLEEAVLAMASVASGGHGQKTTIDAMQILASVRAGETVVRGKWAIRLSTKVQEEA